MQIRCSFCQNMFALSHDMELIALEEIKTNDLHHYDAHCPRCRRSTRILPQQLERLHPNWKTELEELKKQTEALSVARSGESGRKKT